MSDVNPKPAARGRPIKNTMPEPIPDTPENIARAVLRSPKTPPNGWKYLAAARVIGSKAR